MKLPNGPTFTRKQQRTVLIGLCFLVVLILHNTVVSFHVAALRASQEYERVTDLRIKKERIISNELKARQAELKKLLAQHASCENVLFTFAAAEEFFATLEGRCQEVGCEVVLLDYSDQKRDAIIKAADSNMTIIGRTAGLEVLGGYSSIVDLVEALECQSHKVWIDKLDLSVRRSDHGAIRCHLILTVYMTQKKESGGDE